MGHSTTNWLGALVTCTACQHQVEAHTTYWLERSGMVLCPQCFLKHHDPPDPSDPFARDDSILHTHGASVSTA
jgi:hypothetical protein